MGQKLSPKAKKAKAERDLAYAMTDRRTEMKAENQRRRRAAKKKGQNIKEVIEKSKGKNVLN